MLRMITRWCATVAITLALVSGAALSAPPAHADDARSQARKYVLKGDPYQRLGAKKAALLKAAESINRHATGPKRKVLDYKLADKYDRGHKTTRRQFAASWLWSGKKIKNISKSERKIVESYVRKFFHRSARSASRSAVAMDARPRCQGRGGYVSFGKGNWNGYFTSCSTAILVAELRYGGILVGLIATGMGPYAPVGVAAAVLIEAGAEWIDLLRGLSSQNAVFITRRVIGPSTARLQIFTMLPQ